MLKLFTKDSFNYSIPKKKKFNPRLIDADCINEALIFSYKMTYGKDGEHRRHRSGGSHQRKSGEVFCDTFQGKLAEFYTYQRFKENGISSSKPDLDTWELGKWDDVDLVVSNKLINIKSMAFFSNLLLLETKDWDDSGLYIPNKTHYDYFIIVRIKPDIKSVFRSKRLLYTDDILFEDLKELILSQGFEADIPGYIDNNKLIEIIKIKQILPKGSILNKSTEMDADNYYLISDDFDNIFKLKNLLIDTQKSV